MVKNRQLERDLVLKPCLNLCRKYLSDGVILQYRRLDALDKDHKPGSPDIEIFIPKENILWILMAECKKPDGGVHLKSQKLYQYRYKDLLNVVYAIIRSPNELSIEIDRINPYYHNQIKGLTL